MNESSVQQSERQTGRIVACCLGGLFMVLIFLQALAMQTN
jgi:hypothetical protein